MNEAWNLDFSFFMSTYSLQVLHFAMALSPAETIAGRHSVNGLLAYGGCVTLSVWVTDRKSGQCFSSHSAHFMFCPNTSYYPSLARIKLNSVKASRLSSVDVVFFQSLLCNWMNSIMTKPGYNVPLFQRSQHPNICNLIYCSKQDQLKTYLDHAKISGPQWNVLYATMSPSLLSGMLGFYEAGIFSLFTKYILANSQE